MVTTFKAALHENVFDSGIPAKVLADKIGKSYTYLANAASDTQEDSHFQAKDIIPLTLASGSTVLLDFLEHSVGRVAFNLPKVDGKEKVSFGDNVLVTLEHLGGLSREYRKAKSDGFISAQEKKKLEQIQYAILQQVMTLLDELK